MSMTAKFVQIDAEELRHLESSPEAAEMLFMEGPAIPAAFQRLSQTMQERIRAAGPQHMANALSNMPPDVRARLEQRLGRSMESFATGEGGGDLLRVMEERIKARSKSAAPARASLSLEKEWHGVHYLLSGKAEPGDDLLSQAVLGGSVLGEDDEGFSGYGAARAFSSAQVVSISRELGRPEIEAEAIRRFDPERMNKLKIYPGWDAKGNEQVMAALRSLREFYADAAAKSTAIVTCLI